MEHRWGKYYSEIYDIELIKFKHLIDRWQYVEGLKRAPNKVFTQEDFNTYVTIYSGKKVRRWFNADSIYMYTLPVVDVFYRGPGIPIESTLKRYVHCTGIVISKNGQAGLGLKLFFTNEGKRNEWKYLRKLRKKMWYRNNDWQFDREKHDRYWHEKNNSN